jgi:hypothetical protein
MGKWLPILSRVVTKTVFGDDPDRHWNVVQNNGMSSPFLHFPLELVSIRGISTLYAVTPYVCINIGIQGG